MLGLDFDRQRPIGEYIVDFYCKALRLAIEVDGRSHDFKETQDARRQADLERQGVRVVRFWDPEVKTDMEAVLGRLKLTVAERERELGNPPPASRTPPKEGIKEHVSPPFEGWPKAGVGALPQP